MGDYKQESVAFTGDGNPFGSNMPAQYQGSVRKQYLSTQTKYMLKRAKIACDYVGAQVQGLNADDFFAYTPKKIRLSDVSALSELSAKKSDDYKTILIDDPNVDYFPTGAKIMTMGSTFIVTNPYNLSGALPKAFCVRCNTAFNYYDEYGNIKSEPIYIGKELMTGSENEPLKNLVLMEGYYNVVCQLNEATRKLDQNRRIILGSKAYYITGFDDFVQEFTTDRDSVRLLTFVVRVEEPTEYDDMDNYIAGGKTQTFGVEIDGGTQLYVGVPSNIWAHFIVNGQKSQTPVTWSVISSNPDVIKVYGTLIDGSIFINPAAAGTATLTVYMNENPNIRKDIEITASAQGGVTMEFEGAIPKTIKQYTSAVFACKLRINGGQPQNAQYNIAVSGADSDNCYDAEYTQGSNEIKITCLRPSAAPLILTATGTSSIGNGVVSTEIKLIGY